MRELQEAEPFLLARGGRGMPSLATIELCRAMVQDSDGSLKESAASR
jgi:hypothetical protein